MPSKSLPRAVILGETIHNGTRTACYFVPTPVARVVPKVFLPLFPHEGTPSDCPVWFSYPGLLKRKLPLCHNASLIPRIYMQCILFESCRCVAGAPHPALPHQFVHPWRSVTRAMPKRFPAIVSNGLIVLVHSGSCWYFELSVSHVSYLQSRSKLKGCGLCCSQSVQLGVSRELPVICL
jgi:hypothetical protein